MLPLEYIYGDWYWWLGTHDAKKKTKNFMLSLSDNKIEAGSRIEGFCIPQLLLSQREEELAIADFDSSVKWEPDLDGMTAKRPFFETEDDKTTHPIFIAEHLKDDPRYARLCLTEEFKKEFPRYQKNEFLNHAYLFPEGRHPFLNEQNMKWSYESHGPVRKLESTGFIGYEEDQTNVFSYPNTWPEPAMEWLVREKSDRPFNWPSSELVQEIFDSGCHIAPVGRGKRMREPLSLLEYARNPHANAPNASNRNVMDETEWRISFSVAENKLAATVTPVQRHVMVLLKMLKKLYFHDLISTYHLKQLLFLECERKDESFWREENLVNCLLHMLDILIDCLKRGHLPHYIMRESNLLSDAVEDVLIKASEIAVELRRNLLQRTVSLLRRLQSLTFVTHIYLQNIPFKELIQHLEDRNLDEVGRQKLKLDICKLFAQKCKDVIASTLRNIAQSPESEELLLVALKAYQSLFARIMCQQYALTSKTVDFENFLAEETASLAHGDRFTIQCTEYYDEMRKGHSVASFIPASKSMIELRELRRKLAGKSQEEISSDGVVGKIALLKEADLKSIADKLTKELRGQLDSVSYESLEDTVMKELNMILQSKLGESLKKEEK